MRRTFAARSHASVVCAPDVADTTTHSVADAATSAPRYAACSCAPTVTAVFVPTCLARSVARATSPAARPAGSRIIIAYATADDCTHVASGISPRCLRSSHRSAKTSLIVCSDSSTRMSGIHGPARRNTEATRAAPARCTRYAMSPRPAAPRRTRPNQPRRARITGRSVGSWRPSRRLPAAAPTRDETPRRIGRRSRPTAR